MSSTDKKNKVVSVDGFGNSGSGAMVDLLREFDGYMLFGDEIRLVKDPDGLIDLETAIKQNWTEYKADWAIRRFVKLIENLTSPKYRYWEPSLFPQREAILKFTQDYINELTSFTYDGYVFIRNYDASAIEYLTRLLKYKANLRFRRFKFKYRANYTTTVVDPDLDFNSITQKYLDKIIASQMKPGYSTGIMFMGTSPFQIEKSLSFYSYCKAIVVDRDPRDIFMSAQRQNYMPREVEKFITWFKYTRKRASKLDEHKHCLKLLFEDLVLKPEENIKKIIDFLGEQESIHSLKNKYFIPESSAKGVGKWKQSNLKKEIELIEKELSEYLYIN